LLSTFLTFLFSMATDENLCGTGAPATTFTTFCGFINSAGFETIKALLEQTTSRITVFAPIDSAFTPPLPTALDEQLELIQLHIVGEAFTLDGLICDEVISTINFFGDGPQLQKTRCITGGQPFQIGGGNKGKENWPQIGTSVTQVFSSTAFTDPITPFNTAADGTFLTGSNVVSCNGIIQAVDKLLRPVEDSESKSGKSSKSSKGSKSSDDFHRELETDNGNDSDNKRSSDSLQRRKRRLEALLEPNGNIEQLN
jgi:hypothetical protein